jgi:hypothetical protein
VGGALARHLNDSATAKSVVANIVADRSVRLSKLIALFFIHLHKQQQT